MNRLDDGFIISNDLDWYAKDGNMIAHFATGGTDSLPFSVMNNKTNWEYICNFFNQLPIIPNRLIAICHAPTASIYSHLVNGGCKHPPYALATLCYLCMNDYKC